MQIAKSAEHEMRGQHAQFEGLQRNASLENYVLVSNTLMYLCSYLPNHCFSVALLLSPHFLRIETSRSWGLGLDYFSPIIIGYIICFL